MDFYSNRGLDELRLEYASDPAVLRLLDEIAEYRKELDKGSSFDVEQLLRQLGDS